MQKITTCGTTTLCTDSFKKISCSTSLQGPDLPLNLTHITLTLGQKWVKWNELLFLCMCLHHFSSFRLDVQRTECHVCRRFYVNRVTLTHTRIYLNDGILVTIFQESVMHPEFQKQGSVGPWFSKNGVR